MSRLSSTARGTTVLAAAALCLVIAALGVTQTTWWEDLTESPSDEAQGDIGAVLPTAIVTRADVSDLEELEAQLRFEDAVTFVHRVDPIETTVTQTFGAGRSTQSVSTTVLEPDARAVTALPTPGQVINPGDVLYETDSTPVFTAPGAIAPWRTMSADTTGPDVEQLEAYLVAGGWADGDVVVIDTEWTAETTAAIEVWQEATEQAVTGEVALGDIWFINSPILVTNVHATEGVLLSDGDAAFSYTSDRRTIQTSVAELPAGLLDAADLVVRLPDRSLVPAQVQSIQGSDNGFDLVATADLPDDIATVDGVEVTLVWTVNELTNALTLPPEAVRRTDSGTYVVDVLESDVVRTTEVEVLGQAGRVVAIAGVDERSQVLVP